VQGVPDYTCTTCGASFAVRSDVVDRYPGWTPTTCWSCRGDGGPSGGRSSPDRPRGRRAGAPKEENLPLAEVLARYSEGPDTGVFTDGSAHPNPGEGGWGAVYVVDGLVVDQAHGHEAHTTNNRMELTALIAGFDLVRPGTPATVYTDSKLCVDTITQWAAGWERRGWKRKTGPIQNLDLVQELYRRSKERPELELEWIRAHAGARWNEYADSLSTAYRRDEL
jgi:ribonuclease HI